MRVFTFMVIYAYLANSRVDGLSFWGMILSMVSEVLFLSFTGFFAFAEPGLAQLYLQGQTSVNSVTIAAFFAGPATGIIYPSGLIGTLVLLRDFALLRDFE